MSLTMEIREWEKGGMGAREDRLGPGRGGGVQGQHQWRILTPFLDLIPRWRSKQTYPEEISTTSPLQDTMVAILKCCISSGGGTICIYLFLF